MTWLPKFAVCLSYYDCFRLRSDAFAALFLALQIFSLAISGFSALANTTE
jgi:hypothetical protein